MAKWATIRKTDQAYYDLDVIWTRLWCKSMEERTDDYDDALEEIEQLRKKIRSGKMTKNEWSRVQEIKAKKAIENDEQRY